MTDRNTSVAGWTRPELVRLGKIADVAGNGAAGTNKAGLGTKS